MNNSVHSLFIWLDCYTGDASTYQGFYNTTKNEAACMIWSEMTSGFPNHNFCRNYGGGDMYCDYPHCYISSNNDMERCPVPKCGKSTFYHES